MPRAFEIEVLRTIYSLNSSERGRPTSERGCPRSQNMPTGYFIGTPKPPRKSAAPAQQQRRDAIRRDATKPQIIAASFTTGRRPLLVGWGSEHRVRVPPPPTRPTPRATPPTKPPPPPTPATVARLPLPLRARAVLRRRWRAWTLAVAHRRGALVAHSTRRAQKLAALERWRTEADARAVLFSTLPRRMLGLHYGLRRWQAGAGAALAAAARVGAANLRRWQFALRRPLRRWAAAARVRLSRRAARAVATVLCRRLALQRAYGRWWDVADAAATARRAAARDGAPWAWASMRVAAVRALHRWQRVAGARVALPRGFRLAKAMKAFRRGATSRRAGASLLRLAAAAAVFCALRRAMMRRWAPRARAAAAAARRLDAGARFALWWRLDAWRVAAARRPVHLGVVQQIAGVQRCAWALARWCDAVAAAATAAAGRDAAARQIQLRPALAAWSRAARAATVRRAHDAPSARRAAVVVAVAAVRPKRELV